MNRFGDLKARDPAAFFREQCALRDPGGIKAGLFRPITLWPFPAKRTAELATQAKAIVVAEMNLGQMVFEVERVAKGNCVVVHEGRVDGDPINPGQIMDKVKEVL